MNGISVQKVKFTYRTSESKNVVGAGGVLIKWIFPIFHGSFAEPYMAAEALAMAVRDSGKTVAEFAVEVKPCMFGDSQQYRLSIEDCPYCNLGDITAVSKPNQALVDARPPSPLKPL